MLIAVGRIRSPHGLRGHVKVEALSGRSESLSDLAFVYLGIDESNASRRKINEIKGSIGGKAILKFEGIDSIEMAESLKSHSIYIDEEELPVLPKDSFYSYRLEGMEVYSTQGEMLGSVLRVENYPANDCFVVKSRDGKEFLVPAVKDLVKSVSYERNRITIEDRIGLR